MGRFLLKRGCVLTLGAKTQNFPEADVLIEDGRVAEIGPGLRARDAEVVDAADTIVMPGFVDTHRHAWKTLLRHLGGTSETSLSAADYGPHHDPDDVYAATLLGLLSAAEAGVTTVVDHADIAGDDSFVEAALQAHADAGVRTVFLPAPPAWSPAGDEAATRRRLTRATAGAGAMTTVGLAPPEPSGAQALEAYWALARELGLRIHVHARRPGVVSDLAGRGLLAGEVTLVHCSQPNEADLEAVESSGVAIVLTPANDMATGAGRPPLQQLLDRGVRPGLGVDDELFGPGDLFAQMRAVQSVQHATFFDLKLAGKAGLPNLLTTREVIRYATIDGAHAAGLADVTGSLEVGKQADVILLRTDRPNISPVNDPIGAVVWGMDASNVDWVFAGGKALMRPGVLQGDAARARELATAAAQRVTAAAGHLIRTGQGGTP